MPSYRRIFGFVVATMLSIAPAIAQFQMQDSHSTASLRGIHAVSDSVAWASGTDGTVLRTQDGGAHWQRCATPAGAEKLDFRGVWAWSAEVAMILSSGPGDQSRVYLTNDGCAHWTEQARNADKDGFWDAIAFKTGALPPRTASFTQSNTGILVGDPVNGRFATYIVVGASGWQPDKKSCAARADEGGFAASNSMVVRLRAGALHHCHRRQRWPARPAVAAAGLQRWQARLPCSACTANWKHRILRRVFYRISRSEAWSRSRRRLQEARRRHAHRGLDQ